MPEESSPRYSSNSPLDKLSSPREIVHALLAPGREEVAQDTMCLDIYDLYNLLNGLEARFHPDPRTIEGIVNLGKKAPLSIPPAWYFSISALVGYVTCIASTSQ